MRLRAIHVSSATLLLRLRHATTNIAAKNPTSLTTSTLKQADGGRCGAGGAVQESHPDASLSVAAPGEPAPGELFRGRLRGSCRQEALRGGHQVGAETSEVTKSATITLPFAEKL